jgi:glycosyltransferase involved in cell wall biosynthesis
LNKLLSIIIPTRNRKEMVSHAINSALKYSDFAEIIVVSNGDSLNQDVPRQFLDSSFVKIKRSEKRLSMSKNWHFGFSYAEAKWVRFLGDDDLLTIEPDLLFDILTNCNSTGLKFNSQSFLWIDETITVNLETNEKNKLNTQGEIVDSRKYKKLFWPNQMFRKIPSGGGGTIIQSQFLKELDSLGFLFSGISPDWNTSAHFLYSGLTFAQFDVNLDLLGKSQKSSVFVTQNISKKTQLDPITFSLDGLHPRLHGFSARCPSLWLAQIDSNLWARDCSGLNSYISNLVLISSAFNTTPRAMIKMYNYLKTAPLHNFEIWFVFILMLPVGIFNYLKFQVKHIYNELR